MSTVGRSAHQGGEGASYLQTIPCASECVTSLLQVTSKHSTSASDATCCLGGKYRTTSVHVQSVQDVGLLPKVGYEPIHHAAALYRSNIVESHVMSSNTTACSARHH